MVVKMEGFARAIYTFQIFTTFSTPSTQDFTYVLVGASLADLLKRSSPWLRTLHLLQTSNKIINEIFTRTLSV